MVSRKKSEIIHIRVQPNFKVLLEGLANLGGVTSTKIIEQLIVKSAQKTYIPDIDVIISGDFLKDGKLTLADAVETTFLEGEPVLTKLRMYYLASDALSRKDQIVCAAVVNKENGDLFFGEDEIFYRSEGVIEPQELSGIPTVSVAKINDHLNSLEEFAEFREKNPRIKIAYIDFLKMSG